MGTGLALPLLWWQVLCICLMYFNSNRGIRMYVCTICVCTYVYVCVYVCTICVSMHTVLCCTVWVCLLFSSNSYIVQIPIPLSTVVMGWESIPKAGERLYWTVTMKVRNVCSCVGMKCVCACVQDVCVWRYVIGGNTERGPQLGGVQQLCLFRCILYWMNVLP